MKDFHISTFKCIFGLFFLLSAILHRLPNTGAGPWPKATIKNLGEYFNTEAKTIFKQRAVIFHMDH